MGQETKIVIRSSKVEKQLTHKELWKWFTEYGVLGEQEQDRQAAKSSIYT